MEQVKMAIERHESMIQKNTDDIEKLKISDAKQDTKQEEFQKAVDALTNALRENTKEMNIQNEKMGDRRSDNWKFIVSIVLIPLIMFLLNLITRK